MKKFFKILSILLISLTLFACTKSVEPIIDDSEMTVTFIDVGQGDSTLIKCDNHYMLIDGGDREYSDQLYSILEQNHIDKLDIVVATHAHADHIGGLNGALTYADTDLILSPVTDYDSKTFQKLKSFGELTVPSVGDTYKLGSANIEILSVNYGEGNNSSIVILLEHLGNKFLFTGDAERDVESFLCDKYDDEFDIDVLKVGHHGSDTSTSYRFLRMLMPEYAVVSVGKDNKYGHPTEEVLSRLHDADVKTHRTDETGDITFISTFNGISVKD